MKENVVFSTEANAEYVHLIEDVNMWFIDYVIGVAFRTPINFADKMNGLCESGRPYREFTKTCKAIWTNLQVRKL
ncbi:MAG: hypothetical protein WBF33_10400 [Candidatus Nitrosopolaris sp.]|jgi:hypothetical protein